MSVYFQLQRRRKHVTRDCATSSSVQAGAWGTKAQMPREAPLAPGALTMKLKKIRALVAPKKSISQRGGRLIQSKRKGNLWILV